MVHYDPEFYRGKRVFVTGHTGFKGSWLCKMLLMAGAEVTGYSLQPPTQPNLFSIAGVEDKMHSVIGDIRDFDALKAAFDAAQPDIVLHLAAQPIVRDSYKDPRYTYETNVMGTVNLLECVRLARQQGRAPRSVLNVTTDKVTTTTSGPGATVRTSRWTVSTPTPTARAARSWRRTPTSTAFCR